MRASDSRPERPVEPKATYGVFAYPRLDVEPELKSLRERFESDSVQLKPYIPLIVPLTPATLDDLLSATEFVSRARRNLKPLACAFRNAVERGNLIVVECIEGANNLIQLRQNITGSDPVSYIKDAEGFEPRLVIARATDPPLRLRIMLETNRLGRIVALIDALTLVRLISEERWQPVARFPFGIGRIDYYEKILS
ncbi:MAG: hypothetical protein ABIK43_00120 [candidate division WOR-3 bacterium]